jgi:hypothetical protein
MIVARRLELRSSSARRLFNPLGDRIDSDECRKKQSGSRESAKVGG